MIISGCADGIDALAYRYAKEKGVTFVGHPPLKEDKQKYGLSRAYKRRNLRIIEMADFVLAMPGRRSRGTWHSIGLAKKLKVPYKIVKIQD